ncbi:hypothetical protein CVT24_001975 [Panaeolus cyanescens]|uniref:Conserved oligomeric Golgi complex subunit 3 C-terminal domain-containing protein n=1 Tax=Panaeolus cyanescens TaxID=181874 RepID=A0A409YHK9_9AGAR|nr:hypothetical protein CVT24_001975 [Panaeolus cyanescens]
MSRATTTGNRKGTAPTTLSLSTSQRGTSQSSSDGQAKLARNTTISVEDWEAKTPLTDLQLKSISAIQAATERAKRESVPLKSTNIQHEGDTSSSEDDDDDTDTFSSADNKSEDHLTTSLATKERRENGRVGKRLHTSQLLKMVLQDAQTRLFFKAQSVIQSEIRHFVPRDDDLKYPSILVDANKPPTGTEIREKESVSSIFAKGKGSLSLMEKQNTWYPTLKKTVWVLGQLRDFVKPDISEDISPQALVRGLGWKTSNHHLMLRVQLRDTPIDHFSDDS